MTEPTIDNLSEEQWRRNLKDILVARMGSDEKKYTTKPLPRPSPNDRPRLLTEDEIVTVLNEFPDPRSGTFETRRNVKDQTIRTTKVSLRKQMVTPLGINDLKHQINVNYRKAQVEINTPVGSLVNQTMAAPIAQMTLNGFKTAGMSENRSYSIQALREILNVVKKKKSESMTIVFEDKFLTFEEVLNKRLDLTEVLLSDVVADFDSAAPSDYEDTWWYDNYTKITGKSIPESNWMIRLVIDLDLLYIHKITMSQIVEAINSLNFGKDNLQYVEAIASPLSEGIIDVYPNEKVIVAKFAEKNSNAFQDNISLLFLQNSFVPAFNRIKIKGLAKVRSLVPVAQPLWTFVRSSVKTGHNTWRINIDRIRSGRLGIPIERFVRLLEYFKLPIIEVGELHVDVTSDENPTKIIRAQNTKDDEDTIAFEEAERKKGVLFPIKPPSEFKKLSEYSYATTDGSNLQGLILEDGIDIYHSYSNNVREIFQLFGIEAARNFLIMEILDIIKAQGAYIDPRHVTLLVDYMVNRGILIGITFYGMQKNPIDVLSLASTERSLPVIRDAATTGSKGALLGVSGSFYVGKKPPIGTGMPELKINEEMILKREEELRQRVNPSAMSQAIEEINKINFGQTDISPELQTIKPSANLTPDQELAQLLGSSTSESKSTVTTSTLLENPPEIIPIVGTESLVSPVLKNVVDLVDGKVPELKEEEKKTVTLEKDVPVSTQALSLVPAPEELLPAIATDIRLGLPQDLEQKLSGLLPVVKLKITSQAKFAPGRGLQREQPVKMIDLKKIMSLRPGAKK